MTVTGVIPVTKARSKIMIDGEFSFVLYRGEIRHYHICAGEDMEEEVYREICETVLPKRAKKRCLMLLQKRDYTEEELRRKLRDGLYPASSIDEALLYVKDCDYVNDRRYCEDYIHCYGGQRSEKRITADLLKKGVDRGMIQQVFGDLREQGELGNEEEIIIQCLKKKHFDFHETDPKKIRKMVSHLQYKGFSFSTISRVLGNLLDMEQDNV